MKKIFWSSFETNKQYLGWEMEEKKLPVDLQKYHATKQKNPKGRTKLLSGELKRFHATKNK